MNELVNNLGYLYKSEIWIASDNYNWNYIRLITKHLSIWKFK